VDVLTDALLDFPGTIVFISHDPVFLTRMTTRVVEIEDGQALDYIGDYEYYLWKQEQELEEEMNAAVDAGRRNGNHRTGHPPVGKPTPRGIDRRELVKALSREERRGAELEAAVAALEERMRRRDAELASGELYQDHERWHALHLERQQWDRELERLLEKWLKQSAEIDSLQQQILEYDLKNVPEQSP
jgi:ATP-binding cassette, subfamily F, member 3